jgi:hypothetical protein
MIVTKPRICYHARQESKFRNDWQNSSSHSEWVLFTRFLFNYVRNLNAKYLIQRQNSPSWSNWVLPISLLFHYFWNSGTRCFVRRQNVLSHSNRVHQNRLLSTNFIQTVAQDRVWWVPDLSSGKCTFLSSDQSSYVGQIKSSISNLWYYWAHWKMNHSHRIIFRVILSVHSICSNQ